MNDWSVPVSELVLAVPAILFFVYRLLVLLLALWVARPGCRVDLNRFERALAIARHRPDRRPQAAPIPRPEDA